VALTKATGQNINYSDHTTYSNGSYTEEDQYYGNTKNYPAIHVELYQRPDGRSAFNLTRYENGNKNFPPGFALQENYFITGPTASSPTGLPALFLSFTTNYPGPTPPPTPNIPNELAVWYPLNASGQPALHSETNVNRGLQPLPEACKVPSSFGTSAFEVVQTIKDLDTILGTVTTTTTTQWVASKFGTVCVQLASTVNEWYDYNSDTFVAPVVFQSDRPLQTTVIKETVGLQKSTASGAASQYTPVSLAAVGDARVQIERQLLQARQKRLRTFVDSIVRRAEAASNKGVQ
jgi:hypothetical protein